MASKSFCLEDAGKEPKSLPTAPENHSLTPVAYKSSPKKQEREFLQLYIKARAGSQPTQTLRLQHNSLSAERTRKNRDENEYGNESQSPKTAGKSLGKKAILRNIDINNIPNTFTPDKPSRFKLNHEFNAGGKEQVEEVKVSSFNPSYRNHNVSLHDIEFKDGNNFANYAASIEILLPDLKEKESDGLETQNIQSHVNVTELEQEQQRREYEQQTQQQHQNESHQIQTQSHEQAIEIRNTRSTSNRIVFGHNVEAAYSKVFKVYLIWLLSYGVLLGFNFGVLPYHIVFMFAFIIESYFIYEICKKDSNQLFDPVNEKRKLNTSAQIISIIVLEILGLIKLSGFDFPLSIATIPIFITTVFSCYLFNTGDRRNSNALTVIFQTLLSLQILTICLKIDNVLQWSWQGAFWVSWASLVVVVFYCVGLFMMFLFFLCFEGSNISRSYQLVGLVWILTTLAGYVGVAFFLLYGFTDRLEYGSDQDKITKALIGGVSHVIFLAAYTWLAKTKIKKFLRRIVRADVQVEQETKPEVRFEKATEGLPSYIIRFTPSYFLTFDDSLKIKDGLKLRNIKKKVSLMKSYQYSRFVSGKFWKKKDSRDNLPLVENGINHETNDLHPNNLEDIAVKPIHPQIKRILPHRANVSETGSPANLKSKPKDYGSEAKKKFGRAEEELNTEEDRNEKLCFSANDLDFMQKLEVDDFLSEVRTPLNLNKKTFSEKEEDKACIICCDKFPDAVVMSCGHGGICYECALESWKKSQECFMCRAKIDKVLHIDTHKLGKFNMTKVLSATKLVKDRPRREGYQERENFADTMYIARNHI